jgi:hypothetical protein
MQARGADRSIRADVLRHLPVVSQWPVHRQERPSAGGSGSSGHSTSSRQQQESTRQRVDSTLSLTTNSPQTPVDDRTAPDTAGSHEKASDQ